VAQIVTGVHRDL